jgi:hypothetical protein
MREAASQQDRIDELCSRLTVILARPLPGDGMLPDALRALGELIDVAGKDGNRLALDRALTFSNAIGATELTTEELLTVLYFRANIWGSFVRLKRAHGEFDSASWVQTEMAQEMLLLRTVVSNEQFEK